MNLLVDIGNSRIKWRTLDQDQAGVMQAVIYDKDDTGVCLDTHWRDLQPPESVWVANVAGAGVDRQLRNWINARWRSEIHFATVTREAGGVRNAYSNTGTLGVDRWLALIAARHKYGAACIVDCGTAVTIDGLDAGGRHLGGLIIPGSAMMQASLVTATSGIPAPTGAGAGDGLADNTAQAVRNGCTLAIAALIDRSAAAMKSEMQDGLTCVITGGGAGEILPLLQTGFVHDPQLVLEGLAVMAAGKA